MTKREAIAAAAAIKVKQIIGVGIETSATYGAITEPILAKTLHIPYAVDVKIEGKRRAFAKKHTFRVALTPNFAPKIINMI